MRPVVASVVGTASETKWGQVLVTPHVYGVVEMHSPDGIARTRGVSLLTKLTKLFDEPPTSLRQLSEAAAAVQIDDVVSLILVVPVGSTLYLVSRGKGAVYLKRGNKLARLLADTQSLSGDIQPGDTIIAASRGFVTALTPEQIMGVFDHLTPQEVAEKLTIRLHEQDGGAGGAAFIFEVGKPEEVETDTPLPQAIPSRPAPTGKTIMLARAKTFGRRFTTVTQRAVIRRFLSFLRSGNRRSLRRLIPIIIIALFLGSVAIGIRRQMSQGTSGKNAEIIVAAQHSFDEGMALLELNPVKGRERLTAARDMLSPVVSRKLRTKEGRMAQNLYDSVTENLKRAMRIRKVEPELYFDMSLLKAGGTATDVSLFDKTMGILDGRGKTAFTLGTTTKNGTIVGGGEGMAEAALVALYSDKLYVFTPKGIHEIRLSDQKLTGSVIPSSEEWGEIADMAAFGGNVYLLDTRKSRIWKYVAAEKGFSALFEYLNPDTLPDLSQATNMVIDGSVWMGTTNGKILRFTSGKENNFTPQGMDTPLGSKLSVYTSDEAKMLYVLDHTNRRVVVFDKEGLYLSQYVWEELFAPTGLVVSESAGKLFLLRDGKLYVIELS